MKMWEEKYYDDEKTPSKLDIDFAVRPIPTYKPWMNAPGYPYLKLVAMFHSCFK